MSDFTLKTKDCNGKAPDEALVGRAFKHAGNGKVYLVSGFSWNGETDEWCVSHFERGKGPQAVVCVRGFRNFFGEIKPGVRRFTEV